MSYYSQILKNKPTVNPEDYIIKDEEYEELNVLNKKIKKLKAKLDSEEEELIKKKEELINSKYTPAFEELQVYYEKTDSYYDWNTGEEVNKSDTAWIVETKTLRDTMSICLGFDLKVGAVIFGKYEITIQSARRVMKKKFLGTYVKDFFGEESFNFYSNSYTHAKENYTSTRNFISQMFDCDYQGQKCIGDLYNCFRKNKSFEIILKEAPKDKVDCLLGKTISECLPMSKILNLTKPTYKKLKENEKHLKYAINIYDELDHNCHCKLLGITELEYLALIESCIAWEDDLEFYHINFESRYYNRRDDNLFVFLTQYFLAHEELNTNYTFKKFCTYVIEETINQGYENVKDLISELVDYLKMCKMLRIKPNYYSSYLKQTHDIASRNYKIVLETEQEEIFKDRYEDYKDMKIKDYYVVVPKCSTDIKHEGNELGHCVASYIKSVINGDCLIFFLRKDKEESLVTFEVRNKKAVQIRGARNRSATTEEVNAIKKWIDKVYNDKEEK